MKMEPIGAPALYANIPILNIKNEEIKNGIETFKLTKNRMDIKILKNQII